MWFIGIHMELPFLAIWILYFEMGTKYWILQSSAGGINVCICAIDIDNRRKGHLKSTALILSCLINYQKEYFFKWRARNWIFNVNKKISLGLFLFFKGVIALFPTNK